MEINPRKVFERMFGQGGSAADRLARIDGDRSILDAVMKEATGLQAKVGPQDRVKLSEYLDNIREIERRIQKAGQQVDASTNLPEQPAGIPFSYEEHVGIMYDLLALAYQANISRVFTFMMAREVSNRTYPQVGVADGHHATSHHQNRADKLEKLVKIQNYHLTLFARFLDKLNTTRDGDGSLLDHSLILYGSNMSNSNAHNHFPLPTLLLGGAAGNIQGGRHIKEPDHTPMTNILLTMLHKSGVKIESLGDSTGVIATA
jgi:hypothetical protein